MARREENSERIVYGMGSQSRKALLIFQVTVKRGEYNSGVDKYRRRVDKYIKGVNKCSENDFTSMFTPILYLENSNIYHLFPVSIYTPFEFYSPFLQ